MTPEAQRIAIAEACGWRIAPRVQPHAKLEARMCWIRPGGDEWREERLPDFLNDLNVIHEAEKVLTVESGQVGKYLLHLERCIPVSGAQVRTKVENFKFLTATASQRAEAFLRTLGKWTES